MSKKKKPKKPYTPKLSLQKYDRYFLALEEGEVAAHADQAIFWDLGPGERPARVLADLRFVAKKEKIPVRIEYGSGRSLSLFYLSEKGQEVVRVRRGTDIVGLVVD